MSDDDTQGTAEIATGRFDAALVKEVERANKALEDLRQSEAGEQFSDKVNAIQTALDAISTGLKVDAGTHSMVDTPPPPKKKVAKKT